MALRHRDHSTWQTKNPLNLGSDVPQPTRLVAEIRQKPNLERHGLLDLLSHHRRRLGRTIKTYRSPVKEWQVSWFVLGTITLNGTDTVVCKYCRTVHTKGLLHFYKVVLL